MAKTTFTAQNFDPSATTEIDWQDWVPTIATGGGSGPMGVANVTVYKARYQQSGKKVSFFVLVGFDTTGTADYYVNFTLPVTATSNFSGGGAAIPGWGNVYNNPGGAGNGWRNAVVRFGSTTLVNVAVSSGVSALQLWDINTGRGMEIAGEYEAA